MKKLSKNINVFLGTSCCFIIPAVALAQSNTINRGAIDSRVIYLLLINTLFGFFLIIGLWLTVVGDIFFIALWRKKNHDLKKLAARGKMIFWGWLFVAMVFIFYIIAIFNLWGVLSTKDRLDYESLMLTVLFIFTLLFGNFYYLIAWLNKNIKHTAIGGKIMSIISVPSILMIIPIIVFIVILWMNFLSR